MISKVPMTENWGRAPLGDTTFWTILALAGLSFSEPSSEGNKRSNGLDSRYECARLSRHGQYWLWLSDWLSSQFVPSPKGVVSKGKTPDKLMSSTRGTGNEGNPKSTSSTVFWNSRNWELTGTMDPGFVFGAGGEQRLNEGGGSTDQWVRTYKMRFQGSLWFGQMETNRLYHGPNYAFSWDMNNRMWHLASSRLCQTKLTIVFTGLCVACWCITSQTEHMGSFPSPNTYYVSGVVLWGRGIKKARTSDLSRLAILTRASPSHNLTCWTSSLICLHRLNQLKPRIRSRRWRQWNT